MFMVRLQRTLSIFMLLAALFSNVRGEAPAGQMPEAVAGGNPDLRWDNIEGAPFWAGGEAPFFKYRFVEPSLHEVRLEPRAFTILLMPANALLRIHRPAGALTPDDMDIHVSNGSGLEMPGKLVRSSDARSLLYHSRSLKPALVTLTRPGSSPGAITLALFVARLDFKGRPRTLGEAVEVPPPAAAAAFTGHSSKPGLDGWRLEADKPVSIPMEGPAQIEVETRLYFPPTESEHLQNYTLCITVDQRKRVFPLITHADTGTIHCADSRRATLGSKRRVFFKVPAGLHWMTLETDSIVYLRLLRRRHETLLVPSHPLQQPNSPFFNDSGKDTGKMLQSHETMFLEKMQRLARDNTMKDAGLLASMLCREKGLTWASHPRDRALASDIYNRYSRFRNILPLQKHDASPQRTAWFMTRRLSSPLKKEHAKDREIQMSHPLFPSALQGMSRGYFLRIPPLREAAHEYRLPERKSPSVLRLVVLKDGDLPDAICHVQINEGPATPVRIITRDMPPLNFDASLTASALCALASGGKASKQALNHGFLGLFKQPLPIVEVMTAELPLPEDARTVRLWHAGHSAVERRPYAALQYRDSVPYKATQMEYLSLLRRASAASPQSNMFLTAYHLWSEGGKNRIWLALQNQWFDLFRWISGRCMDFTRKIAGPEAFPALSPDVTRLDVPLDRAKASLLEGKGHWLAAYKLWSRLTRADSRAVQREAEMKRIASLEKLGELFLVEQQLQGLYLHDADPLLREAALKRLKEYYSQWGDTQSMAGLLAFVAVRNGEPEAFRELISALVAGEGAYRDALKIGLGLAENKRPVEDLLMCAYKLRWWTVFEKLLADLQDAERRHFWRALRNAGRGEYGTSLECFNHAGLLGQSFSNSLSEALRIRGRLEDADPEIRCRAVLEWEAWIPEQPGPWAWHENRALPVDYEGTVMCYSPSKARYSSYCVASDWRPLRINVQGPIRLRMDIRPLHPAGSGEPLDGWITVRHGGRLRPVAVTHNLPTTDIQITGNVGLAGTKVTDEIRLGPGHHAVEVASPSMKLLVRLFEYRPELPLGILPPLTETSLTGIVPGPEQVSHLETDPLLAARMALRLNSTNAGKVHAAGLEMVAASKDSICEAERMLALHHLDALSRIMERNPERPEYSAHIVHEALLEEGRYAEVLQPSPDFENENNPLRRMQTLAFAAEHDDALLPEARIHGGSLFSNFPEVFGLKRLHERLNGTCKWEAVESIDSSAGMRSVAIDGWAPESRFFRIRKELLPDLKPEEKLVSGNSRLGISLQRDEPGCLMVQLSLVALRFMPAQALTVMVKMNDEEERRITLHPHSAGHAVLLQTPKGDHAVHVWIEDPLPGQYVKAGIRDPMQDTSDRVALTIKSHEREWQSAVSAKRNFFVATAAEPLTFSIMGPDLLRIDEFRDNMVLTSFRAVGEGRQELSLRPDRDQNEAMFRIFRQNTVYPEAKTQAKRQERVEPEALKPPPFKLDLTPLPAALALNDVFDLGGQEDGTWTLAYKYRQHHLFDEDLRNDDGLNKYHELQGIYRYADRHEVNYFKCAALSRANESKGPTFGSQLSLFTRAFPYLGNLRLGTAGYLQNPDGEGLSSSGRSEWSLSAHGSVSQRFNPAGQIFTIPSLTLSGRIMSLNDDAGYRPGRLDPDVYTDYKRDHKYALRLSNSVIYRPWLDTALRAKVSLASNEDLYARGPDSLRMGLRISQYLYHSKFDVGYRMAQYFHDNHRSRSRTRQQVSFQVGHDFWASARDRIEFGLRFEHDLSGGETGGFISVVWHFSNGRMYRDFDPGSVSFIDLRNSSIPPEYNNAILEEAHE